MIRPALYVVATPIGHPDDITLRALEVLRGVDFIICEDEKPGRRLRAAYQLTAPLEPLNEHNESERSRPLLMKLLEDNACAALVSDGGTPLFADPGNRLVRLCREMNIPVMPVPGASSLMAALMVAGLPAEAFHYIGFLPANRDERLQALRRLPRHETVVMLEAPYRLPQLLRDMRAILGDGRGALLAWRLTHPEQRVLEGTLGQLAAETRDLPKGEFVLVLHPEQSRGRGKGRGKK